MEESEENTKATPETVSCQLPGYKIVWFMVTEPKELGTFDLNEFTLKGEGHYQTLNDFMNSKNWDIFLEQHDYKKAAGIYKAFLSVPPVEEFEELLKLIASQQHLKL